MKVVIITGQTATGKTKLALSKKGVLINADARQIYKYLNIITGKDKSRNKNRKSKVLLYDIIDPKEYFSSYDYQKAAIPLIKKILEQGKTPIIVGGTYLYLSHLLYDVATENIPPNWKLRRILNNKPVSFLQQRLYRLNPDFFKNLNESDKKNPQRLIRKIEIFSAKKPVITSRIPPRRCILEDKINLPNIKIEFIGLRFKNKKNLVHTIKKRVEKRIDAGAIKEVKDLLKRGYTENDPGLKTIGYKQIIAYLKGNLTKEEAINQWIAKEIQYAKRHTFMKKDPNICWQLV